MSQNCVDCPDGDCPPVDCYPCNECGCPDVEICDCPSTPVYTSGNCATPMNSSCVAYDGVKDDCIDVTVLPSMSLNAVIKKILDYVRGTVSRFTAKDTSVTIVPVVDTCNDKATIKVNVSAVPGNSMSLKVDGLFVAGTNIIPGTCYTVEPTVVAGVNTFKLVLDGDCLAGELPDPDPICDSFPESFQQANTKLIGEYSFATIGINEEKICTGGKVKPPLGFAVIGYNQTTSKNRQSAFGKMEWFATLDAANTAATAGETILIYQDTDENITIKPNVNYQGVGFRNVNQLIFTYLATGTSRFSNLKFLGGIICPLGVANKIVCTNCEFLGDVNLTGTINWIGGIFLADGVRGLNLSATVKMTKIISYRAVQLAENAELSYANIDWDGTGTWGLNLFPTQPEHHCKASHCNVNVSGLDTPGVRLLAYAGKVTASHISVNTINGMGVYAHHGSGTNGSLEAGNAENSRALDVSFISATTIGGIGFQVVCPFTGPIANTSHKPFVNNCSSYSFNGVAWSLINGNIKNCTGYSVNNYAMYINATEDLAGRNLYVTDCVMESQTKAAYLATGDIYISGGTFITHSDTDSPIMLNYGDPARGIYFIDGVKIIQKNPLLYSITCGLIFNNRIRISNNSFICPYSLAVLPGINPILLAPGVIVPTTTDTYGNVSQ